MIYLQYMQNLHACSPDKPGPGAEDHPLHYGAEDHPLRYTCNRCTKLLQFSMN